MTMEAASFDLPQMVRSAQAGDRAAFAALVTRYKNLVFSVALGVLRDADAAADVTQNVFVTAWQKLAELRQPGSLPPWLRETARRQALQHLRSRRRAWQREQVAEPDSIEGAEAQLAERQEVHALGEALDSLPAEVREILLLYYSEEQSVAQVAQLLEIGEDAVKKRLQRARQTLRADVEERLGARARRILPGAALVAAVLAALDTPARAALIRDGKRPTWRPFECDETAGGAAP
jgi:RNA polymerase sigma factor (sigma-70 family)